MKFTNYLSSIEGISIYPMISFLLFFIFFLVLTLHAVLADKKYIEELSNIPFNEGSNDVNKNND